MDPSVEAAIELALQNSPGDVALRAHLISQLLEDGESEKALSHCLTLLAFQPDHLQGLALATVASEGVGQQVQADAYRRIVDALEGRTHAAGAIASAAGSPVENEIDNFLSSVLDGTNNSAAVTLDDVGGLDDVKQRLQVSFIGPMKNVELRKMYGNSLRGGLLLWGPPGCGKTYLARAIAGELGANFISVGLHEVLDMFIGNSEKKLHSLFEDARRHAPTVLFFDEIDAIGMKRTDVGGNSAMRNVITQFLSELDGMGQQNEGIFVLGATNSPWDVDPALRRPGRFDRSMLVLPPDHDARIAILRTHCTGRPNGTIDFSEIANRTNLFSGADLKHLCESSAQVAMERAMSTGRADPIETSDFDTALVDIRPSTPPWFKIANNFAMFANSDGDFDDLVKYMKKHKLGKLGL